MSDAAIIPGIEQDEQPALFPFDEVDLRALDTPEASRRYTAESLERNRSKRDAIIGALAEGHGLLRIARAFGCSHHLVSALRDSRPELIAIEKEQMSRKIARVLHLCLERFEQGVMDREVSPAQLPIAFGILSDKKALLDGDATARVEITHRHEVSLDLVAGYLKKRGIEMPAIDVESTVSSREPPANDGCNMERVTDGDTDRTPPNDRLEADDGEIEMARQGREGGGGGITGRADFIMGLLRKIFRTKDA